MNKRKMLIYITNICEEIEKIDQRQYNYNILKKEYDYEAEDEDIRSGLSSTSVFMMPSEEVFKGTKKIKN